MVKTLKGNITYLCSAVWSNVCDREKKSNTIKKIKSDGRDGKTEKRKHKRKDIQRQHNNENEGKASESHLNKVRVVGHLCLPTLTHLTDTPNISHWTINGPMSCVCVCAWAKGMRSVTKSRSTKIYSHQTTLKCSAGVDGCFPRIGVESWLGTNRPSNRQLRVYFPCSRLFCGSGS